MGEQNQLDRPETNGVLDGIVWDLQAEVEERHDGENDEEAWTQAFDAVLGKQGEFTPAQRSRIFSAMAELYRIVLPYFPEDEDTPVEEIEVPEHGTPARTAMSMLANAEAEDPEVEEILDRQADQVDLHDPVWDMIADYCYGVVANYAMNVRGGVMDHTYGLTAEDYVEDEDYDRPMGRFERNVFRFRTWVRRLRWMVRDFFHKDESLESVLADLQRKEAR